MALLLLGDPSDMKTKKYSIRVTRTQDIDVILPEPFAEEEFLQTWSKVFFDLTEGKELQEIACYVAGNVADNNMSYVDGIGDILQIPYAEADYEEEPRSVLGGIMWQEHDYDIITEREWEEG